MPIAEEAEEFSRVVTVESVGDSGRSLMLEADADELEAVKRRLGIDGLSSLRANALLRRTGKDRLRVDIDFSADVLQSCVVTLEPVALRVSDAATVCFQMGGKQIDEPEVLDPGAPDPPEPLVGGRIDVGELVVQHLALAIDPYPRKDGAELSAVLPADGQEVETVEQLTTSEVFAGLAKLKQR